jgi:hypothetical protein
LGVWRKKQKAVPFSSGFAQKSKQKSSFAQVLSQFLITFVAFWDAAEIGIQKRKMKL